MVRRFLVAFLLLGLALGLLCGAHFRVGAAADRVEITETALLGDPAALEGLALDLATYGDHGRHLRWDTRCTFTGGLSTQSRFTYHQTPDPWERSGDDRGQIYFDMPSTSYSISSTGFLDLSEEERGLRYDSVLVLPMIDVAGRAPAASTYTEQVRVRDYYDFFPLSVNFRLLLPDRFTLEEETRLSDAFRSLFRVPVPEEFRLDITVVTNELGQPVEIQTNPVEPDAGPQWIDTFCANTGDALYFTANCRVGYEEAPLTPEVPGGYGLYVMPLEDGRLRAENLDHLELAYPIAPQRSWILALEPTEDGSRLLLVTQEEGWAVLTVIDRETMENIQRLELFPVCYEEDNYVAFSDLYTFSGCLLLHDSAGNFLLLTEDGTGGYGVAIRSTLRPVEAWDAGLCYNPSFAYDGERLAAAAFAGSSRYTCGFYLAVYDPSGLLYAGEYAHSQDRRPDPSMYPCFPAPDTPIRLTWE